MLGRWQTSHNALAKRTFSVIKKELKEKNLAKKLESQFPKNLLEFVETVKPIAEGRTRRFPLLPFWNEIYKDSYSFKMIVGGRQIHKTTYVTDILAHEAITRPGSQLGYVTFNQLNLSSFSRQKMLSSFLQNPAIKNYLKTTSNVSEISFKNGSRVYAMISNNRYRNIEGKSLHHVILDEAQYQPMHDAQRVIQTMNATKGALTICGIGGEAGSPYEGFWKASNQCEFIFDEPDWRQKLQFDESGLVYGKYLDDLMSGKWVAQSPENTICHGYHLSQTMFPENPLTMDDAVKLYKVNPIHAIEFTQKTEVMTFYTTNVLGQFYNSVGRPITPQMISECTRSYRDFGMLYATEIAELKELYGNRIRIAMGVDFGSGNSSDTVIAIVIEWRLSQSLSRYTLAAIAKRPAEHQLKQAEYITSLFHNCWCDVGVGDLGYGAIQVKVIQDGGYSSTTGQKFEGAGPRNFFGCRSLLNEERPVEKHHGKIDEHGDITAMITIDKNVSIQKLVDLIGTKVPHPLWPIEEKLWVPKLMIPSKNDDHIDFLVKDLTKVTRKDILDDDEVDSRQNARREFNHPPDSVMAIVYAMTALETKPPHIWFGGPLPPPNWKEHYFYWQSDE